MLCSYNSSSFQLCCLRFLNTFLETATSLEERVYIQEELRQAGLESFDLQSVGEQVGPVVGGDGHRSCARPASGRAV